MQLDQAYNARGRKMRQEGPFPTTNYIEFVRFSGPYLGNSMGRTKTEEFRLNNKFYNMYFRV